MRKVNADVVLVTGGAGYVGAHACKALAAAGLRPVAFDDLSRGWRDAVRWGPLIVGDVRDREAVRAALRSTGAAAILHFAAKAEVGESVRNPALYFDVNVGGAKAVAAAAVEAGVDRLVFSSTCAVYGLPETTPIRESAPLAPINPYGESKLAAETIFRESGLRGCMLRYFNAAGADPSGDLGERHDPETHLIPLAIRATLPGDYALKIMGTDYPTPDGSAVRDYVHVSDLAKAHVLALRQLAEGGKGLVCNLGVGRGYSVKEVVAAVEAAAGRPARTAFAPRRPGDAAALVADASAARSKLGWRPERTEISEIVGDALRWETRALAA